MKLRNLKRVLFQILFLFIILLQNKSIVYSQVISVRDSRIANDSLKCFTYSEARQIITDLRKLPIKDSIINRLDSIIVLNDTIIHKHENTIDLQRVSIRTKNEKIGTLRKNRKLFLIFGILLGFSTQLLF